MNIIFLFFVFYLFVQSTRENEITKKPNKHKLKWNILDVNVTRLMRNSKIPNLNARKNDSRPIFARWSAWSRCEDCLQTRMKTCISSKCKHTSLHEERSCNKKRCARKRNLKKGQGMHVLQMIQKKSFATRTMRSRIWSKWSEWSDCSGKCRTQRHRYCKKPGRCKKQRDVQVGYCYHERTNCEKYVLNIMDTSTNEDLSKYRYDSYTGNNIRVRKKCGRPLRKPRMLKIIGGRESKKYKWPWQVAVINSFKEVFCAGTLIAPKWVLTAAHCLRYRLFVRFNEHDLTTIEGREEEMEVKRMYPHPQFNHFTVDNDIALLKLPRPVRQPVACLPTHVPVARDLCYVMGWGKEKTDDVHGTRVLKEAKIPVVTNETCKKAYRKYLLTENMFCAGWKSGFADTCAGDSGGGLMCPTKKGLRSSAHAVQGITSFGDGCGRKNKYGIYTNVVNYVKWIEETMEKYS